MPKSILVIDDNVDLLDSLRELFGNLGCTVETAPDGYRGIEKAAGRTWDLILLDVKMPGIDGIETARRIKSSRADAFIVLMTAFSIEELAERALKAGVDGVIIKPFDAEKLLDYLAGRSAAAGYFSVLEQVWSHMVNRLGRKSTRFLFEGILKKGVSGDEVATFLERTGDGIFVNRFGGDGKVGGGFDGSLDRLLEARCGGSGTPHRKTRGR